MIDRNAYKAAIGAPDEGFNRAVDAALREIKEREDRPVMKRKFSVGLLVAIVAILALTGAALAVGLNLFQLFGRNDARLARIAEQAVLETDTPGEVETEKTGKSAVEIANAWYDGESLIVAYTQDEARRFEPFTPTPQELAKMEPEDEGWLPYEQGPLDPVQQAYIDAVEAGTPCGFVEYSVFASDHMFAGEIELMPSVGDEITLEDGRRAFCVEFETPLPEGARNQEELTLRLPILRHEYRVWFDGKDAYMLSGPLDGEARTYEWIDGKTYTSYATGPEQIGEAVATVKRSDIETRRFAGKGSLNGVPVQVEATVSALRAEVRITSDGKALADPVIVYEHPDGGGEAELRYDFSLTDETGAELMWDGHWVGDDRFTESAARLTFEGVARLPERLELCIIDKKGESEARIEMTREALRIDN